MFLRSLAKKRALARFACSLQLSIIPLISGQTPAHAGNVECYAMTRDQTFLVNMDGVEVKTMSIKKGLNVKVVDYDARLRLALIYRFGNVRVSNLTSFSMDCDRLGI